MVITIHQPEHLPWLGYFNKMSMADVYVILDSVQYEKGNFQSRNKIMGTNGAQWLSVPVVTKGSLDSVLTDIVFADSNNPKWRQKYLNTLYCSYRKYPYFEQHYSYFEQLMEKKYDHLVDFNVDIICHFANLLNIHPKFIRASQLQVEGKKSDLVLNICKKLKADTYISGAGGREYMKLQDFDNEGIKVIFQNYKHPIYPQYNKEEFIPYLSTLDMLFNLDCADARKLVCCE